MSPHTAHALSKNAYLRALRGAVAVPSEGKQKLVFQIMMVFCMVTCMVTCNWLIHTSQPSLFAFSQILYEYPLTFAIALFVRTVVANPIVAGLAKALVPAMLSGFKRTLAMTAVNVATMATIMTFFGVLISNGPFEFTWLSYLESLPTSYALAFFINLLAVGPFVKIIHARFVTPQLPHMREKAVSTYATVRAFIPKVLAGKGE